MAKKPNNNDLKLLRDHLKKGELKPIYILYGPESQIRSDYEHRIAERVPDGGFPEFNRIILDDNFAELSDFSAYDDAWESMPMMSERKLLIIRSSGIFKSATEAVKEFWLEKLSRPAPDMVVIFNEPVVDKRSVLYKAAAKVGMAVEFDYQTSEDLVTWLNRRALDNKCKLDKHLAEYLVNIVEPGLGNLTNEFDKLLDYCGTVITKTDIDKLVTRSAQMQAFDLTNAIMEHDAEKAMRFVNSLRTSKESAFGILYLMLSSAEKLLKVKNIPSKNKYDVAAQTKLKPFVADLYIKSAAGFSEQAIRRMITRIPEIDFEIKSGRIEQWTAVEQYIAECIYYS